MTERLPSSSGDPDEYIDIPRRSPIFEVSTGARTERLTWYNTTVVLYTHPNFRDLDHVALVSPQLGTARLFRCGSLIQQLIDKHYPVLQSPEPLPGALESYYEFQQKVLEQELPDDGSGTID